MQVLIITASFPFPPGEQFLENEIAHWTGLPGITVRLLPMRASGNMRSVPRDIVVDPRLSVQGRFAKLYALALALTSGILWRELCWLLTHGRISMDNIVIAFRETRRTLGIYKKLESYLATSSERVVVYCYWFDSCAYAAALLKRKARVAYVITRAHRYDVYEEFRPHRYMPLKRQFVDDIDRIAAVCSSGAAYLVQRYQTSQRKTTVERLGVGLQHRTEPSEANTIRVLSISFCIAVKRIDRIIDAIHAAAADERFSGRSIEWLHIGDGPLRSALEKKAVECLSTFPKVRYKFLGSLPNSDVLEILNARHIDVLLNVSESEGVPVSIMEAMSFGVPVIAPCVGGISEIVDEHNGTLLKANASVQEIVDALARIPHYKDVETRRAAVSTIERLYSADLNYSAFVKQIISEAHG